MSLGRRLNVDPVILDMEDVQRWFADNGTVCESHRHKIGSEPLAEEYYQSDHSFAFLCGPCNSRANEAVGPAKNIWDKQLATHMYALMCRRSYVQTNVSSGFVLEEMIEHRAEVVRELGKIESRQRAAEQREIRKHIRESPTKVGMADDEILTARQRQENREQSGTPRLGPARIDRGSVLRARLILPPPTSEEGE